MKTQRVTQVAHHQRPRRVVIIDDTEDLRVLLRLALVRGGFEVIAEAGDGQAGIDVVRETRPDVVLLDLSMPVLDGIEALPTIRRLCPSARIIVLSGFGAQQLSDRAVAAGADGYVQKGAPLASILDYVRAMCATTERTPARALSVVSSSTAPGADRLEARPMPTYEAEPGDPDEDDGALWAAFCLAPYGVIEVRDEPLFRVVRANAVGQRLLGPTPAGTPLAMVSAELSAQVSYHRLTPDASFDVEVGVGRVRATLRRAERSVLVFLDCATEDVGMLRREIATTAHEIRGPVAVLCGIAETLSWTGDLDAGQRERLMGSVARQARILDSITADLLTAAQIQRGTLRLDLQDVMPRTVVEGVVGNRPDVALTVDDPRTVRADPLRLEQMLSNLLGNAYKYGAAPYGVRVRADADDVLIEVVDHGAGVPPEFRDRLFQEFARADDAVATGTGLGLYVVRTLARAQHGEVTYAPGEGHGSRFTIRLPASHV